MGNVSARCRRVLDIARGLTVEDAMDTEYDSLEQVEFQVTEALREAGLESSNLIVGIDFTKSNEWTGKSSFGGRSLHDTRGNLKNPYEQAILIIGQTLSDFDEDNLIPCFGFGDVTTHDKDVFSFNPDHSPCNGFMEALQCYRELAPGIKLSGPTSFAPIIETAMRIVDESGGQYHVLLIIADGQVSRSCDVEIGHYSPQEEDTIAAIVEASKYPLSIVLVGVGDGPWELMKEFDDRIPERAFDNFQFVNFTEIMSRDVPMSQKEAGFAAEALMKVPDQYQASINRLLGGSRGTPRKNPLPPPTRRHGITNFVANSPSFFHDRQHGTVTLAAALPHAIGREYNRIPNRQGMDGNSTQRQRNPPQRIDPGPHWPLSYAPTT